MRLSEGSAERQKLDVAGLGKIGVGWTSSEDRTLGANEERVRGRQKR